MRKMAEIFVVFSEKLNFTFDFGITVNTSEIVELFMLIAFNSIMNWNSWGEKKTFLLSCLTIHFLPNNSACVMVFCYQNCSDLLWEKLLKIREKTSPPIVFFKENNENDIADIHPFNLHWAWKHECSFRNHLNPGLRNHKLWFCAEKMHWSIFMKTFLLTHNVLF